jgi:hypothetical protein
MTKRPTDTPVDTHRDIKRIRLDIEVVKGHEEALLATRLALEKELAQHPEQQAEYESQAEERRRERLNEFLPSYLYKELVVKGSSDYGRLIDVHIQDDFTDPLHLHEMDYRVSVKFSTGKEYEDTISVDVDDPKTPIYLSDCEIPRVENTIHRFLKGAPASKPPKNKLHVLWNNAVECNGGDIPSALFGLVLWSMNKRRIDGRDAGDTFLDMTYGIEAVGDDLRALDEDEDEEVDMVMEEEEVGGDAIAGSD